MPGENLDIPVKIKQKYVDIVENAGPQKYKETWINNALSQNPAAVYLLKARDISTRLLCRNPNPEVLKIFKEDDKFDAECIFHLCVFPHGYEFIVKNNLDIMPGCFCNLFKNPAAAEYIKQIVKHDSNALKYFAANPLIEKIFPVQNLAFSKYYSSNPSDHIIDVLLKHQSFIDWRMLSRNPNPRVLSILENNIDKIHWDALAEVETPAAIKFIEENINMLNEVAWEKLSANPFAIHILDKYIEKIDIFMFLKNPRIFEIEKPALAKLLF